MPPKSSSSPSPSPSPLPSHPPPNIVTVYIPHTITLDCLASSSSTLAPHKIAVHASETTSAPSKSTVTVTLSPTTDISGQETVTVTLPAAESPSHNPLWNSEGAETVTVTATQAPVQVQPVTPGGDNGAATTTIVHSVVSMMVML